MRAQHESQIGEGRNEFVSIRRLLRSIIQQLLSILRTFVSVGSNAVLYSTMFSGNKVNCTFLSFQPPSVNQNLEFELHRLPLSIPLTNC